MQVYSYFYRITIRAPMVHPDQRGMILSGILNTDSPIIDNEYLKAILQQLGDQANAELDRMDLTSLAFLGVFEQPAANDKMDS